VLGRPSWTTSCCSNAIAPPPPTNAPNSSVCWGGVRAVVFFGSDPPNSPAQCVNPLVSQLQQTIFITQMTSPNITIFVVFFRNEEHMLFLCAFTRNPEMFFQFRYHTSSFLHSCGAHCGEAARRGGDRAVGADRGGTAGPSSLLCSTIAILSSNAKLMKCHI